MNIGRRWWDMSHGVAQIKINRAFYCNHSVWNKRIWSPFVPLNSWNHMPYFNEIERANGRALLRTIAQGHEAQALHILQSGLPINLEQTVDESDTAARMGSHGGTPLMLAAKCGSTRIVLELLRAGACATSVDFNGLSALMFAALNAHPMTVRALLDETTADATAAMRQLEFICAIGKLMQVPQLTTSHASCALMILHCVSGDADTLLPFFPVQSQDVMRRLHRLVLSHKHFARARVCGGAWRGACVAAAHDAGRTRQAAGLVGGCTFGHNGKKWLVVTCGMLRRVMSRRVMHVSTRCIARESLKRPYLAQVGVFERQVRFRCEAGATLRMGQHPGGKRVCCSNACVWRVRHNQWRLDSFWMWVFMLPHKDCRLAHACCDATVLTLTPPQHVTTKLPSLLLASGIDIVGPQQGGGGGVASGEKRPREPWKNVWQRRQDEWGI
jgi:hypothetical protein